ncbi:Wzz/FepE/Etk N-terminal domain-containing protein [uncultured Chloroflexus sp.]|uniref:Wzz/FepE/Etk N-terminal domain-containing protein n=1 Tax=uncultured Chloroflexus sp. TaxID=214040 RepID=UPI00262A564E|nr:Wzz/FepE/Etk N-terminal domain-containing protein [uncultured Chloroflexus sp.]
MEDEIDLKPYLRALLRRWWIIIGVAVGLAIIVAVTAILRTPPYTASSSVLIVPASAQVTLDSRFTSHDSMLFTTTVNQREALLALTRDATLEEQVATTLAIDYRPGELVNRIAIDTNGDLVRITARAETSAEAERLATAWAKEYARLVTETYTRDTASLALVEQQLAEAQMRYQAAQAALEAFIAQGEITTADQEVRRLSDLVNSTRSAGTNRFAEYLRRSNDLEQILRDARLLRERLNGQAGDEADTADAIAALLLRIRNLSDRSGDRPILQLDSSLTNNTTVTALELDRLIAALEAEQRAVRLEAERLSKVALEELSPAASKLLVERFNAAQARYEQLAARQRELTRTRDQAFNLVEILMRRIDELRVADAAPQVTVRYLGTVTNPGVTIGRQALTQAAVAALAGVVLAAAVIVAMEAMALARREKSPQLKPTGD